MKVLIVSDAWHPQVNGVVRTYEHLQPELETLGHSVRVVGPGDFPLSLPMPGYAEIRLTVLPYRRLAAMIDAMAPDLLHIATEGPLGLAARRYAVRRGMPFTTCYHTQFPDYIAMRARHLPAFARKALHRGSVAFLRWFHEPSAYLLAATPTLAAQLRAWDFCCPIRPMTRGVDAERFHPAPDDYANDPPVALYVGRIAVEKNLEAFLDMEWTGVKRLVGGGPDLDILRRRYPDAVFSGILTGEALAEAYRSADVFVFPSRTDTFGMVLVEAMASGLPVAAYPVCGPVDIVTDDFLGTLDNDLGAAARLALGRGTRGARAAHARKNYSWAKAARQFLDIDK